MIRSMTGYGEASSHVGDVHYFLEVRSLNSKYFKTLIRMPDEFQGLEAEIESRLRARVARGSITVKAACTDASARAARTINHGALDAYVDQLRQAAAIASGDIAIDLSALIALPGVLQDSGNEEERLAQARQNFLTLLDRACEGLVEMRKAEGRALSADLAHHRDVIADRLTTILDRSPAVIRDFEARLKQRIEQLFDDAGMRPEAADLMREVAGYAEKTDIAEETNRLQGHIEQFTLLIEGRADVGGAGEGKPIGRTLDFLAQEMLREANTMASKSSDVELSRAIVEIKGAIDRIKEQVQNVE
ncbi:MAG: YicC/YloC family endoribonuclease [Planctomycetota bacterium]